MGKRIKKDEDLLYKYRGIKINGIHRDLHRYIMEEYLGRKLKSDEVVHHIDGNTLNNDISNLIVMSRGEHTKLHMQELPNLHKQTSEDLRRSTKNAWKRGVFDHLKKPVVAFDKKTGELVKVYESAMETEQDGHQSGHIGSCCNGHRKSHHGLIWKYLDDCPELKSHKLV